MPISAWYERFQEELNVYADQYDVLVFNTVIGAGFSIDSHFHCFHTFFLTAVLTFKEEHCFHAFFLRRMLTFKEERQFLASFLPRLRLIFAVALVDQQSYFLVQKGWGGPQAFGVVYETYEKTHRAPPNGMDQQRYQPAAIGHDHAGDCRAVGHSTTPHRILGQLRIRLDSS